jgi:hypothetical protein
VFVRCKKKYKSVILILPGLIFRYCWIEEGRDRRTDKGIDRGKEKEGKTEGWTEEGRTKDRPDGQRPHTRLGREIIDRPRCK